MRQSLRLKTNRKTNNQKYWYEHFISMTESQLDISFMQLGEFYIDIKLLNFYDYIVRI